MPLPQVASRACKMKSGSRFDGIGRLQGPTEPKAEQRGSQSQVPRSLGLYQPRGLRAKGGMLACRNKAGRPWALGAQATGWRCWSSVLASISHLCDGKTNRSVASVAPLRCLSSDCFAACKWIAGSCGVNS